MLSFDYLIGGILYKYIIIRWISRKNKEIASENYIKSVIVRLK